MPDQEFEDAVRKYIQSISERETIKDDMIRLLKQHIEILEKEIEILKKEKEYDQRSF